MFHTPICCSLKKKKKKKEQAKKARTTPLEGVLWNR